MPIVLSTNRIYYIPYLISVLLNNHAHRSLYWNGFNMTINGKGQYKIEYQQLKILWQYKLVSIFPTTQHFIRFLFLGF